jgi:hypothetical protein
MTKQKKQSGRKATRSGKNSMPQLALAPPLVFGFPPKMLTRLRYVDTYSVTSSSGSLGKQVIYLNSTFDPDNTGTGHQPLYRDTYAAIYDQYAVVSARLRVTFCNTDDSAIELCGVVIDDDNASSTTANTLMEQNYGQSAFLPPKTGSISSKTFTVNWDCKKQLGIDPFTSELYKTAVGSNPTEVATAILWAANAAAGSTTYAMHLELEQTVLWTELTTPIQS